ncbi:MAG: glycosyltransferase family 2 protein [Pseudomonadota bacterium]
MANIESEPQTAIAVTRDADALVSVIVPCYNEEEVIEETHRRLTETLSEGGLNFEIIYVNDGSADATLDLLRGLAESDEHTKFLSLSRNFGHQLAVTAGIDVAQGESVVVIDADLQDPPAVICEMHERWLEGADVVYGQRKQREGESAFKLMTAKAFYQILNRLSDVDIPMDVGDFRLMDREVATLMAKMRERDRYLRGMVAWLGFKQVAVKYDRDARFAGETKYPLSKMFGLAFNGLMSFSMAPLRFVLLLGMGVVGLAALGVIYAISMRLLTDNWVDGWTLLFIAVMMLSGVQLIVLGAIGEYVGRIYMQSKERPLYAVRERRGFQDFSSSRRADG